MCVRGCGGCVEKRTPGPRNFPERGPRPKRRGSQEGASHGSGCRMLTPQSSFSSSPRKEEFHMAPSSPLDFFWVLLSLHGHFLLLTIRGPGSSRLELCCERTQPQETKRTQEGRKPTGLPPPPRYHWPGSSEGSQHTAGRHLPRTGTKNRLFQAYSLREDEVLLWRRTCREQPHHSCPRRGWRQRTAWDAICVHHPGCLPL